MKRTISFARCGTVFLATLVLTSGALARAGGAEEEAPSRAKAAAAGPDERAGDRVRSKARVERRDKIGIGSDVTVGPEETVEGDVVCLGARALVEGTVQGGIVVIAGSLQLAGRAAGDVVGIASRMKLEEGAEVRGDLVNIGGHLDRTGADVRGQVVNIGLPAIGWKSLSSLAWLPLGFFGWLFVWGKVLDLVLFLVGLVLLVVLVPERVVRIGDETPVRFVEGFFVGILGYLALIAALALVCITIVGIPILLLAFTVVKWLGLAGIFHSMGRRLGRAMGRDLTPLGAALLGFLPFAVLYFFPWVGWATWLALKITAVGLVLLTRAGRPAAPLLPAAPPAAAPSQA